MHTDVKVLFANLWQDYVAVTPSAKNVHRLLGSSQQDDVINDHITLRTFNLGKVGLEKLAARFIALGYEECGEYQFEAQKAYGKHYEHAERSAPKVVRSALVM